MYYVVNISDELTSTCEALKSSLNKSNLEVERLNNCLRNLEDATSALQEQNKILQRQLDSSHDKVLGRRIP